MDRACVEEHPAPFEGPPEEEYMQHRFPEEDEPLGYDDDACGEAEAEAEDDLAVDAARLCPLAIGHGAGENLLGGTSEPDLRSSLVGHDGGPESGRTKARQLREDTTGLPEYVDWEVTRALLHGAKVGGVAPGLMDDLTHDDRNLLEMILTGAIPTERRLAAANLPRKGGAFASQRIALIVIWT